MALAGGRLTTLDRRIIALAVPALGALIVEPLYTLTDTAIVGHLGRAQLGGLALATTVLNLIGWTAAFLEMATVSQVAFRRGRGTPPAPTRLPPRRISPPQRSAFSSRWSSRSPVRPSRSFSVAPARSRTTRRPTSATPRSACPCCC